MATVTDASRPGMRTSEFALAAACGAVVLFQDKLGIILQPSVENLFAAAPMLYIGGRNVTKIAALLSGVFGVKVPDALLKSEGNQNAPSA